MKKSNKPRAIGAVENCAQNFASEQLAVHRTALPGETAMSLASWTAALNGLSLKRFCRDFGIRHSDLAAGDPTAVLQLAELTGSDVSMLLQNSPQHLSGGQCILINETVSTSLLRKAPGQICPVCIANSTTAGDRSQAIQNWKWQLSPLRRCRIHDVMLEPLEKANDPFDFATAIQAWVPSVVRPSPCIDPRFEEYLVKRLETGSGTTWLDALPIHVVVHFSEALGTVVAFGSDSSFEEITDEQKIEASALGFHHLSQGTGAVQAALEDLYSEAGRYRTAYRKLLAPVLKVLADNAKDAAFDGLRDLVREFVRDNFHIPDGTDLLGEVCSQSRVYTAFKAGREFGLSVSLINRELKKRGLRQDGGPNHKSDPSLLIPRRKMLDCVESVKSLSSITVVQTLLGLDRFVLEQLEDAGLLLSYFGDDRGRPMYEAAKVAGFLEQLHAMHIPNQAEALDWPSVLGLVQSLRCSTGWLIAKMLIGRVRLSAKSSNAFHLDDFRVSKGDVQHLLSLECEPTVSVSKIAKMLGTKVETARGLVEYSAIKTLKNTGAPLACVGEVEAFNREYILLRALAGSMKSHFKDLKSSLAEDGCLPLLLGKTESAFYPRTHVYRLARSSPIGPIARLLENEALGPRRSTPVINRQDYNRGAMA